MYPVIMIYIMVYKNIEATKQIFRNCIFQKDETSYFL